MRLTIAHDCVYKIASFASYMRIAFEDVELPVAVGVVDNLYADYGNTWMYIPQVAERHTHNIVENMHVPYKRFMEDCEQFIDEGALSQVFHERKELLVRIYGAESKNHHARLALKAAAVRARLGLERLDEVAADRALRSGDLLYLQQRYGFWRSMQCSPSFWKWLVPIEIPDEELFFALCWMFQEGCYDAALKVVSMQERAGVLGPRCQELGEALRGIEAVYRALGHRDLALAQKAFGLLEESGYPYWERQFDWRYLRLYLQTRGDVYEGDCSLTKLAADAANLVVDYPQDGLVCSLAADIALFDGDRVGAQTLYARALDLTRHAFALRHARERLAQIEED